MNKIIVSCLFCLTKLSKNATKYTMHLVFKIILKLIFNEQTEHIACPNVFSKYLKVGNYMKREEYVCVYYL